MKKALLLLILTFPLVVFSQTGDQARSLISTSTIATTTEPMALATYTYEEITAAQVSYFSKYGKYLQVLPGNKLPHYEKGTVEGKLGKYLPDNARVDVYESPQGKGFWITYMQGNVLYSQGYGPEASNLTYTRILPVNTGTASSTRDE